MAVPYQLIIAFIVGLGVLYLIGWLFLVPLKFLSRLLLNALAGGVLLVILSWLVPLIHLSVMVNAVTALIAGFLGVPGVLLVVVLTMILP